MTGKRKVTELDAAASARPPPPRRWRGDGNDDDHSSLSEDSQSDKATLGDAEDERSSGSEDHVGSGDSNAGSEIGRTANMMLEVNLNSPADSHSDKATLGDADDERSSGIDDHVGSGDSNNGSEIGRTASNMMLDLNQKSPAESSDSEELAATKAQAQSPPAADQLAEMEVQLTPPTDQSVPATEVADHSVAAAAPAPEMVVPAATSVWCGACGREPSSVRQVPVVHYCLCLPCRSNPSDPSDRPRCVICDSTRL